MASSAGKPVEMVPAGELPDGCGAPGWGSGSTARASAPWTAGAAPPAAATDPAGRVLLTRVRGLMARFEDTRDLRLMGGYKPGSDPELDRAVVLVPKIYQALEQDLGAPPSADPFRELSELLQGPRTGSPAEA